MHMISKKDLNSGEMDTLTKSCSPTIVITANGEVQTQEEAIVKELDIFLTMKVLENTPASRPVSFPPHPIPEEMLRHSFVWPRRKEGPPSIWDLLFRETFLRIHMLPLQLLLILKN